MHPETNVHATAHALVRHNGIDLRVLVQNLIKNLRFFGADGFLAGDFIRGVGGEEGAHDFAGDPDAEDGEGVVEGVVLGDDGPV